MNAPRERLSYRRGGREDLLIRHATMRQAARVAALQTEVKLLGEMALASTVPGMRQWRERVLSGRAPNAHVRRRRAARYRLQRALKHELLDRFCGAEPAVDVPEVALVVAHPDDESIGAGVQLCRLDRATVIHMTDGAPLDPAAAQRRGFASREEYAETRSQELHRALALAGVPPARVRSLGFIDGELSHRLVDLCLVLADLLHELRPHIVITHPYEGGHTDHDATAFATHLACGLLRREGLEPPALLELASYHARNGRRVVQQFLPHERADRDQRVIQLGEQERALKQRMYDCFTSQKSVLQTFATDVERFRPAPRYIFTRPPHAGRLDYELRKTPIPGAQWRRQAERALRALRVRDHRGAAA